MKALSSLLTHFNTYTLVVEYCIKRVRIFNVQTRCNDLIILAELMKRILQQFKHAFKQPCESHRVLLSQSELLSSQEL